MWNTFKLVWARIPKRVFYIIYIVLILGWLSRFIYDLVINNATVDLWLIFSKLIFPLVVISLILAIILFIIFSLKTVKEVIDSSQPLTNKVDNKPNIFLEDFYNSKFCISVYVEPIWKKKHAPNIEDFLNGLYFKSFRCACKYDFTSRLEHGIFEYLLYYQCSNQKCMINPDKIFVDDFKIFQKDLVNIYRGMVRENFDLFWNLYKSKIK